MGDEGWGENRRTNDSDWRSDQASRGYSRGGGGGQRNDSRGDRNDWGNQRNDGSRGGSWGGNRDSRGSSNGRGFGGDRGSGGGGGFDSRGSSKKTIQISSSFVGKVIGRGGSTIKDLSSRSGARININKDSGNSYETDIDLTGTDEQIDVAEQLIKDLVGSGSNSSYSRN